MKEISFIPTYEDAEVTIEENQLRTGERYLTAVSGGLAVHFDHVEVEMAEDGSHTVWLRDSDGSVVTHNYVDDETAEKIAAVFDS